MVLSWKYVSSQSDRCITGTGRGGSFSYKEQRGATLQSLVGLSLQTDASAVDVEPNTARAVASEMALFVQILAFISLTVLVNEAKGKYY